LEDIKKLLGQVANAKIITLIIIGIFIGILIWKNSDFISEVSFTIKNGTDTSITKKVSKIEENKTHLKSNLVINKILLPPSPEKLPSIIVIEIKNIGKASALNIKINIDLGIAQVIGYEIIGFNTKDITNNVSKTSILNISLEEIRPNENGYIYLHTNIPIFKSISISSKDTDKTNSLTLSEYLQNNTIIKKHNGITMSGFLEFLLGIFILIMSAYFTIVLITYLNKKTKLFD
jgi:hypothetical protein